MSETSKPPVTSESRLAALVQQVRRFAADREWDRFHSPKNLAMALIGEAGELVEQFQWLTEEQSADLSAEKLALVEQEIGDVFIYLLQLCNRLGLDPVTAAERKLLLNARKYPVEKARGNAKKYTDLE